jgi:hypothetical protein
MLTSALQDVQDAFTTFEALSLISDVPDEQKPSAVLVTIRPGQTPNSTYNLDGDPYALAEVMLMAAKAPENPYFRDALIALVPELIKLAD